MQRHYLLQSALMPMGGLALFLGPTLCWPVLPYFWHIYVNESVSPKHSAGQFSSELPYLVYGLRFLLLCPMHCAGLAIKVRLL